MSYSPRLSPIFSIEMSLVITTISDASNESRTVGRARHEQAKLGCPIHSKHKNAAAIKNIGLHNRFLFIFMVFTAGRQFGLGIRSTGSYAGISIQAFDA